MRVHTRQTWLKLIEGLEQRTLFATTLFQIDPTLSQVSVDGEAFSIDLDEQGGGSLSARYEGSILADLDGDSIRFLGGSTITAQSKGNYDPGNAAANYAGEAEGPFGIDLGKIAIRGLVLDTTSPDLALTDGSFTSTGVTFRVKGGTLAYDTNGAGSGTEGLDGNEGTNKTKGKSTVVTSVDGVATLTIPIDVTIEESGVELRLRGKFVAKGVGSGPFVDANGPTNSGTGYNGSLVVGQETEVAAVDPTLTVSDADDTNVVSGKITLTNASDGSAEDLSVVTSGTGITASGNGTGTITLSGAASVANYQTVLRSLRYANSDTTPTLGDRIINITLNDGDGDGLTAVSTIDVTDPNVATLATGGPKVLSYTDADGTITTFTLKGPGSVDLKFTGASEQVVGKTKTTVSGTSVALTNVVVTDPTLLTKLTVKTVGGTTAGATVGSITANASVGQIGGAGVNLAGTLAVTGKLGIGTFGNVTGSAISAGSIGKLTITGAMSTSTVSVTDPFASLLPTLGSFTVVGAMTDSSLSSKGSVLAFKAGSMTNSQVLVGTTGSGVTPASIAFAADAATIRKVTVGAKTAATPNFDNSIIAGKALGAVVLNLVDTANGGTPFGVVADTVTSLTARNATAQSLKLKKLDDPATAPSTLSATGFAFGDMVIRIV